MFFMEGVINKKGAAHFEMIFSFVFFVGFVFFLFIVLKPQDTSTLSGSVIAALYDSFEEDVHTNLSSMFLKANYTGTSECFNVTLPGYIFDYAIKADNSYVTNLDEVDVDSDMEVSGGDGVLKLDKGNVFFRVLVSPEFNDGNIGDCDNLINYNIGSVVERKVVSYKALVNMTVRYRDNYEALRSDLKVPPIFDFAIIAENMSDIRMEPQFGVPDSVEVQAQDYVVEVLRETGEVTNERFTLKIW